MSLPGAQRFVGICFRAHDPRWAFSPMSGEGARLKGGRFNPNGTPALYLALDLSTAVLEASQGFANRIAPLTLVTYDVECDDILDLTDPAVMAAHRVTVADLSDAWAKKRADGQIPLSWALAGRLTAAGAAGIIVPSFASGAGSAHRNLVLWTWSANLPHKVIPFDPHGQLPRDQSSWS
jgi:RES domain-containing protein